MWSHSVVKLYEATQMFVMDDYVREMTVTESCKYGEYGSFERLLLLVSRGTISKAKRDLYSSELIVCCSIGC